MLRLVEPLPGCERLGPEALNVRVRADAAAIRQVRCEVVEYAERLGAREELCDAVRLALSEALTNVVRHAYSEHEQGDMIVEARHDDDDHLAVMVCDEGRGLVPAPRKQTSGLGLGLSLMAQMANDFAIANRDDQSGTIVSMRFPLGGVPSAPAAVRPASS